MTCWLSAAEFADAAEISAQAARKAMRQALGGARWRDCALRVRGQHGAGARAGLRLEVDRASLPFELQLPADREEAPSSKDFRASQVVRVDQKRLQSISAAFGAKPQSADRSYAIAQAAEAAGHSPRTVYRWLRRYEHHGLRGLARKRPSNAGRARVLVSRPFDRAWFVQGGSLEGLEDLTGDVAKTLKGLWASRAEQAGGAEIRRLAEFLLLELTEARGMKLPADALRLSRRTVERFAAYRVVNQRRHDRTAYADARPRIRRDWTQLAPMERVIADVKHLDLVAQLGQPPAPVMRCSAGFDPNPTARQLLEERDQLRAGDLPLHDDLTPSVDAVDLEHRLGDIQAHRDDLSHGAPPSLPTSRCGG